MSAPLSYLFCRFCPELCKKKGLSWINLCVDIQRSPLKHFLQPYKGRIQPYLLSLLRKSYIQLSIKKIKRYRTDISISCLRFPAIVREIRKTIVPLLLWYCVRYFISYLYTGSLLIFFFSIIRTNDRFSHIACQFCFIITELATWNLLKKKKNPLMVNLKKKKGCNVSEAHLKLKIFLIHAWLQ